MSQHIIRNIYKMLNSAVCLWRPGLEKEKWEIPSGAPLPLPSVRLPHPPHNKLQSCTADITARGYFQQWNDWLLSILVHNSEKLSAASCFGSSEWKETNKKKKRHFLAGCAFNLANLSILEVPRHSLRCPPFLCMFVYIIFFKVRQNP